MLKDLTIIYYTLNKTPKKWHDFHMLHLEKAIGNTPVISISREPMDFGLNLIDIEEPKYSNIYRQILRAAKMAKTKYVATAEDDVLYCHRHYKEFRPKDNEFAYNHARWSVFSWEKENAIFCLRQRISNCSLIAPRELLIEALEERFARYEGEHIPESLMGECGRNKLEKKMRITLRKQKIWWSTVPIIHLNHPEGTDERQAERHKLHGQIKAYDIPYWGKAKDIACAYQ